MYRVRRSETARSDAVARPAQTAATGAAHGGRIQEASRELETSAYMTARSPKLSVLPGTTVTLSGSPCCRLSRFSPLNVSESPRKTLLPTLARRRVTPLYFSQ